jgi:hypothetical protein
MTAYFIGEKLPHLPTQTTSSNWVIIDSKVDDLKTLVEGVVTDTQVFILDSSKDGITQITELFRTTTTRPQTLHLITHGSPGTLQLGQGELNLGNIDRYRQELQTWSVDNLLLYGCQVAAGDAGAEFLAKLQTYTGANIAASATKVGNPNLLANWDLDITLGPVKVPLAFSPALMATYAGVFSTAILYVQDEDNENNFGTGTPDLDLEGNPVGDFGPFIRVGFDRARDVTGLDPEDVENDRDIGTILGPIQPIEFNIFTDIPATIGSAFLFLSVFDVDLPGEINQVSFNGTVLGNLEGEDGLTFKSVFPIDPALVNLGQNLVQIEVDLNEAGFEAAIEKAELLINYQIGETLGDAFIDVKETDEPAYNEGDTINFTGDIDTTATTQDLKVEVILRDPSGAAVDFNNDPNLANLLVTGQPDGIDDDSFTWSVAVPDNPVPGIWRIDISAFDNTTGDFQFLDSISFPIGCGIAADPSVFQFKQFVQFELLDENRPYEGSIPLDFEINGIRMASLYDETFYLGLFSDVQNAIFDGRLNYGFEHFVNWGIAEGRDPSFFFSEGYYLDTNPDVKAAVDANVINSGLEHFLLWGHVENRNPSELFNANDYLLNNIDVQNAIADGRVQSAFDHYIEFGASESRAPGSLLYEEAYYLQDNPDVANAVLSGQLSSGFEHYVLFGQSEAGRDPSPRFNESAYLGCNPDVAQAVQAGVLSSGMEHYFRFGRQEGRVAFEVPMAVV